MTVVEAVRKKVDPRLLASRCKEGNCSVSLDQMSGKFALIHVDVPGDPPWSLAERTNNVVTTCSLEEQLNVGTHG